MNSALTNWKTSLAGLGALLIPIVNEVIPMLPPSYAAIATGFVSFLGLLFAQDAKA